MPSYVSVCEYVCVSVCMRVGVKFQKWFLSCGALAAHKSILDDVCFLSTLNGGFVTCDGNSRSSQECACVCMRVCLFQ